MIADAPVRRRARSAAVVLLVGAALAGCGGRQATTTAAPAPGGAQLRVVNERPQDMSVTVLRPGGARWRLGTATAHETTTLAIPAEVVGGGGFVLRFVATPVVPGRAGAVEEIAVAAGDVVQLTITADVGAP